MTHLEQFELLQDNAIERSLKPLPEYTDNMHLWYTPEEVHRAFRKKMYRDLAIRLDEEDAAREAAKKEKEQELPTNINITAEIKKK